MDALNITNMIVLSKCTTQELLNEVARRYNQNPANVQEAISRFMYQWAEMQDAHDDELFGNDEQGNHGSERPF